MLKVGYLRIYCGKYVPYKKFSEQRRITESFPFLIEVIAVIVKSIICNYDIMM